MKYKLHKKKAFTLIELMVAMGIFVIVIVFSGEIFKVSIESHRTAIANAEIMHKFRAITDQLDSDFKGLDKDGEIVVVWAAVPNNNSDYSDNDFDGYERFDRIMFFANGDFQSYGSYPVIRGNTARICYSMAKIGNLRPEQMSKPKRILARTQHILTDDESLTGYPYDSNSFSAQQWMQWNNTSQYDKISKEKWKFIPMNNKIDLLSLVLDTTIKVEHDGKIIYESQTNKDIRGISIDTSDSNSIHSLLCEGAGEFKVQGWDSIKKTWVPEVDPDGDGKLTDTHFFLNDPDKNLPVVLYSWPLKGLKINNINYLPEQVNRENFNLIPGLGRALKFTFTLFDSKGIIKAGRTFTHIVYLDS